MASQLMAGAVPLLFVALFADPVLFAWTGRHYPEAAWTARVLATAEFASLLTWRFVLSPADRQMLRRFLPGRLRAGA